MFELYISSIRMTSSVNYRDTDYENNCISFEELRNLKNWMETRETIQKFTKVHVS